MGGTSHRQVDKASVLGAAVRWVTPPHRQVDKASVLGAAVRWVTPPTVR